MLLASEWHVCRVLYSSTILNRHTRPSRDKDTTPHAPARGPICAECLIKKLSRNCEVWVVFAFIWPPYTDTCLYCGLLVDKGQHGFLYQIYVNVLLGRRYQRGFYYWHSNIRYTHTQALALLCFCYDEHSMRIYGRPHSTWRSVCIEPWSHGCTLTSTIFILSLHTNIPVLSAFFVEQMGEVEPGRFRKSRVTTDRWLQWNVSMRDGNQS